MPSYKNYLLKSKIIKALSILNIYKLNIAEHYIINGKFPDDPKIVFNGKTNINIENSNRDIKALNYKLQSNVAMLSAILKSPPEDGKDHIYINGKIDSDLITWKCTGNNSSDSIPEEFYPNSCKGS